jgi:hypothetical protein
MNWTELFREVSQAQENFFTNGRHERFRSALDATGKFFALYQQSGSPKHETEVPTAIAEQVRHSLEPATFPSSVNR